MFWFGVLVACLAGGGLAYYRHLRVERELDLLCDSFDQLNEGLEKLAERLEAAIDILNDD